MVGAALALTGCDDGRPRRVLVAGQVLIDGQPLEYGFVRFIPSDARPSGGQLDRQGRFRLSCFEDNDGAVPGRHKVTVTSCESIDEETVIWYAPKKYAQCDSSGLEQVIEAPNDSIVINLTWDGGRPFVEVEPSGE